MAKFVAILGKPGSGKSTLTKKLNLPFISAGEIARKYLPTKASKGMFVDQKKIARLVSREAAKYNKEEIVIFDGTPLSKVSLEEFGRNGIEIGLAIYLEATDEEVKKRLEKRGRDTDLKYFNRRLLSFNRITKKVIEYFELQNKLIVVDARNSSGSICLKVRAAFGSIQ